MKRTLIALAALLALLLSACGAAASQAEVSSAETEPADYEAAYAEILNLYRDFYSNDGAQRQGEYIEGVGYTLDGCSMLGQYVGSMGYALADVDGNGVKELIIAADDGTLDYPNVVFDMFTLVDGQPQRVLISWERSLNWLTSDGKIINQASGDAFCSYSYLESLSGAALTVEDGVLSGPPASSDSAECAWYRTGDSDGDFGNDTAISADEASGVISGWFNLVYLPELSPLVSATV